MIVLPCIPILQVKSRANLNSLLHSFHIFAQLTPTELEVLELLMKDYTRQEVSELRYVEHLTLKSQINSILRKFNKRSVQEIVPVLRELHIPEILSQRKRNLKAKKAKLSPRSSMQHARRHEVAWRFS